MYNVPFHLSNFNSQQTSSTNTNNSNNNKDHKAFASPLTATSSLDSPPGPSGDLLQQPNDLSYQKLPSSFNPLNSASPAPSHKALPPTMTNTSGRPSYDMYDTTPTPTNFKPQQHPLSQQQHSPQSRTNTNVFYANNDDWVTSPHPSSSVVGNTLEQDTNDADDYGASPNSGTMDDELQQQHMQQLFEKKRRRRESHNAVERRRRDNINERIFELSTLLPERDAIKNNKGTILRKSVEHIRMLHEEVGKCQHRIQELENMLGMYRMRGVGDMDLDLQQQRPVAPLPSGGGPSMMQQHQTQQPQPNMNFPASIQPQLAYRRDG